MKHIFILFYIVTGGCASINPYYGLHLSDSAHNEFFEGRNENQQIEVSSENELGNNEFNYTFPDSLGGSNISGSAVVEVNLHLNDNSVRSVNLIGMKLYNKADSSFIRHDKYYAGSKRVIISPDESVRKYMPFIEQAARSLNYSRKANSPKQTFAYCRFHFNKATSVEVSN